MRKLGSKMKVQSKQELRQEIARLTNLLAEHHINYSDNTFSIPVIDEQGSLNFTAHN